MTDIIAHLNPHKKKYLYHFSIIGVNLGLAAIGKLYYFINEHETLMEKISFINLDFVHHLVIGIGRRLAMDLCYLIKLLSI